MTRPPPGPTKGEERRQSIRTAAYHCFRDAGYHETSVDTICEKAGISKGSFYWHYDTKQAVFVDILETWTREVVDELHEQFEAAVANENYVQAIIEALARETRRGRLIIPVWLEFAALSRHEPRLQEALGFFYRRMRAAIAHMLRPITTGHIDEGALEGVAAGVLGAYAGILMQDLAGNEDVQAENAMLQVMSVLRPWLEQGYPVHGDGQV